MRRVTNSMDSGGHRAQMTLRDLVKRHGGLMFSSAVTYGRSGGGGALALDDARLDSVADDLFVHSGSVRSGDIFAALPGLRVDGVRYSADAASRGASVILVPATRSLARVRERIRQDQTSVARGAVRGAGPLIWIHPRAGAILGELAADLYGRPGDDLALAAVTGTNGKTSVCHLASQLLSGAGFVPATLGTAGHTLRGSGGALHLEATHTTPDATELQRLLARHLAGGGDSAVMEASSHALSQGRLDGLKLAAAAFTNLTREHLDYHGTLARYAEAKAKLWDYVRPGGAAVIFDGSPVSEDMASYARGRGLRVVRVGVEGHGSHITAADGELIARDLKGTSAGASFIVEGLGMGAEEVHLPLRGAHNVENALVALALSRELELSSRRAPASGTHPSTLLSSLGGLAAAPGRLEVVPLPPSGFRGAGPFEVIVDYAHSPDALERVLAALRTELQSESARLLCVFGCGGDRDRGKRGPMGRAAGRLADVAIVTSDNPRSESPEAIAEAIVAGIDEVGGRRLVELDRARAIERALGLARAGDIVLIAGKGHENTQVIDGRSLPFDDRVVAAEAFGRQVQGAQS